MNSRAYSRLLVSALTAWRKLTDRNRPKHRPRDPKRILVIHQLLLGDTLMTLSLLSKLREQYPDSHISTAVPEGFVSIMQGNPLKVEVLPFNLYKPGQLWDLIRQPNYDLALVPGDNRYGWTAYAMGARWICGFSEDTPGKNSGCFDELRPYSDKPAAWTDMVTDLCDGPSPQPYTPGQWQPLGKHSHSEPVAPYTLIHVGAKTPLKLWPTQRWESLIRLLREQGKHVVVSCGPGEQAILEQLDLPTDIPCFPGNLPLSEFWQRVDGADTLVCLDNGVAHMARLIGTPTVCLFGPASQLIYGAGLFFGQCPYIAVSADVSCRDQTDVFKRDIPWARTCERSPQQCPDHICMSAIEVNQVMQAIEQLEHQR